MMNKSLLYLWKERTLFIGYLDEPMLLSQGASTLSVSMGDPMLICDPKSGVEIWSKALLIPAGCSVRIDTKQQPVANLNLDVMGEDFFYLSKLMSQKQGMLTYDLIPYAHYSDKLSRILEQKLDSLETKECLKQLLNWGDSEHLHIEYRVQQAVNLIQNSIEQNLSTESIARQVNLSVSGLTKLFKKQTGVPIRRYRQWHRLYVTATEIAQGRSLTEAALIAGFVDLSHCTNTFTQVFGIKPSYFLQRPEDIQILTEHPGRLRCH